MPEKLLAQPMALSLLCSLFPPKLWHSGKTSRGAAAAAHPNEQFPFTRPTPAARALRKPAPGPDFTETILSPRRPSLPPPSDYTVAVPLLWEMVYPPSRGRRC